MADDDPEEALEMIRGTDLDGTRASSSCSSLLARVPSVLRLALATAAVVWVVMTMRSPWPSGPEKSFEIIGRDRRGFWYGGEGVLESPRGLDGPRVLAVHVGSAEYFGFGVPSFRSGWHGLRLQPLNTGLSPDEYAEFRGELLRRFRQAGEITGPIERSLLRASIVQGTQVLWGGVVVSLLLPIAALAAIVVMPWRWLMVEIPADIYRLLTVREDPTRCARCKYPLGGLPTRLCPECGHDNPDDPRSARPPVD